MIVTNLTVVTSIIHEPNHILIASGPLTTPFMLDVLQAYQLIQPDIYINLIQTIDSDTQLFIQNNTVDIALSINVQTQSALILYPDLQQYPLLSTGLGLSYNIPDMPASFILQLRMLTYARIMCGDIQYWNHSDIQYDNPNYIMPYHVIIVIVRGADMTDGDGKNMIISHAFNSIYPQFGETGMYQIYLFMLFTPNYITTYTDTNLCL